MSEKILLTDQILLRVIKCSEREFENFGITDADFITLHDGGGLVGVAFWRENVIEVVVSMSIAGSMVEHSDWFYHLCDGCKVESLMPSYDSESGKHDGMWVLIIE